MTLAWLRDLVIVVFAVVGIISAILITIIVLKTYRRIVPTLDSAKAAASNMQTTVAFLSDVVVKPIITVYSLARGVRGVLSTLNRSQKKNKEGK